LNLRATLLICCLLLTTPALVGWSTTFFAAHQVFNSRVGYFVLTSGTYTGSLGGITGADSKCYDDLLANNWLGKSNTVLTTANVKAFLCDGSTCNEALPSTTYKFATSGNPSFGGATFTTNAGGLGPNDASTWAGTLYFGATASYWTNRGLGTSTLWTNVSAVSGSVNTNCTGWTSPSFSQSGIVGISNSSTNTRWKNSTTSTCDFLKKLVCFVHP